MSVARSLLAIALLAFPKGALGQIPWPAGKSATAKAARPARASTLSLSAATTVTEAEPNDLVSQAQHVTLGDIAGGTISVTDDVDSYAIDLVAGSKIELDVLASRAGSPLDPTLTLLGPDGVTVLAFNDDYLTPDSHIELFITSTGRYFIQVQGFSGVGSPTSTYALSFGSVPEGPGVHVEAEHTGGELRALLGLARLARRRAFERLLRQRCGHHDDAVVGGDDDVA